MLYRLTDEHSVERITMEKWELSETRNGSFVHAEASDPVALTLSW